MAEFTDQNDGPVAGEILLWSAGASAVEYQEILIEELGSVGPGGSTGKTLELGRSLRGRGFKPLFNGRDLNG